MQGTLWKWTNYFTGWQPRWFVLEQGILSYYRSEDDVVNGCKGSIKMSVCDVNVHPTDYTRLDLIIPGEAHFYVKAATPQERQEWLVALGSCKAGLPNGRPQLPPVLEDVPEDELRAKRSELRLYCDLLMQQVHSVKDAVKDKDMPDTEKLNEASSLLSATCDTFIGTLEQCMKLANAKSNTKMPTSYLTHGSVGGESPSSPTRHSSVKTNNPWGPSISRQNSSERYIPTKQKSRSSLRSRTSSESSDTGQGERPTAGKESSPNAVTKQSAVFEVDEKDTRVQTFFSAMPVSFMDIQLHQDGGIPVGPFLEACRAILIIFDKLSPTAFAPVKLDISGNIRKIQQKYSTDPGTFEALQGIVHFEKANQQSQLSQSATVALLWLKRALEFIREFLTEFLSGNDDLEEGASIAYTKTLKNYHTWVVRAVFGLAVKAVPERKEFQAHLSVSETDIQHPDFERTLMKDVEDYVTALDVLLKIIQDFYSTEGLDSQEQV